MAKSSIVVDIDDPRSAKIAEVISNKTAKKILSLLAESEMSSSEIAEKLTLPLNTVTYNMGKLVESGLVDKVNKVFWSSRGKRMEIYKVSNRRIVISPKKIVRGILPALIVTLLIAAIIGFFQNQQFERAGVGTPTENFAQMKSADNAALASGAAPAAESFVAAGESLPQNLEKAPDSWAWYLVGAMSALVVVIVWRMIKDE